MAEQPFLSKRQRGIVNTYYANADGAVSQKVAEAVSDIALAAGDEKKVAKLWTSVEQVLAGSSADPARAAKIIQTRDLEALARLAPSLKAAPRSRPQADRP
jgi:hypothetical protein